jgi:hypothetical protein
MEKNQLYDATMFSYKTNEIITKFTQCPTKPLTLDIITNCNCLTTIGILNYLLEYVNSSPKLKNGMKNINCKMEYYYTILLFIVRAINYLYTTPNVNYYDYLYAAPSNNNNNENYYNNIDKLINNKLLLKLSAARNGNMLLDDLDRLKYLKSYLKTTFKLNHYILYTSSYGTFETFVWWIHFANNNINKITSYNLINHLLNVLDHDDHGVHVLFIDSLRSFVKLEDLIVNSVVNSDNRIFKYILCEYKINNKVINFTDELLKEILDKLNTITFNTKDKTKYKLKRIKLLSECVNIGHLFDYIISTFKSSQIIITLHKFEYYYNKPHQFNNISNIIFKLYLDNIDNGDWDNKIEFNKAIKYFKTTGERNMALLCYLIINEIKKKCIAKQIPFIRLTLIHKYEIIINMILWNRFLHIINWTTFNKDSQMYKHIILNINALLNCILDNNYNTLPVETIFLKVNKRLYFLRCIVKKCARLKFTNKLNKIAPITLAIKQQFNQLQFDHFIKKPTVIFSEINKNMYIMGNINYMNTIVLQSSNLPTLSYINSSYRVKIIEFDINDTTIYGIIDIDIPHTTYDERCTILSNAHPFKQNNRINIDSLETYKKEIEINYKNMTHYVNENKNNMSFLWWHLRVYKYSGIKETICRDFIKNNSISSVLYYQDITIYI